MKPSPTPWRIGKNGEVVSDQPGERLMDGSDEVDYYGGYLVCESVTRANAEQIIAAVNAGDERTVYNLNSQPLSIAAIHQMLAMLCAAGTVTVINAEKIGPSHVLHLLNLMHGRLSDEDKEWISEKFQQLIVAINPL